MSSKMYKLMYKLHTAGNRQLLFIKHVEHTFDGIRRRYIFRNQIPVYVNWIKASVKKIFIDQYLYKTGEVKLQILLKDIFVPCSIFNVPNVFVKSHYILHFGFSK